MLHHIKSNIAYRGRLLLFSIIAISVFSAQAQDFNLPDRIMVNPLASASTGIAITWRSGLTNHDQFVQWSEAHSHPVKDFSTYEIQKAVCRPDTVYYKGKRSIFRSCRTTLTNLDPGNTYMYRVGNNEVGWSEWIQVDMPEADPDGELTFIYLGDPQNDLRSQWSRTIREAYTTAPDADFILYAGDLVNDGYNDSEWKEWYDAGSFTHRMVPSVLTPGNHEYTDVVLTPLWRSHFTLPKNGPAGIPELEDACYYVDFPNLRVISLDGEQIDEDPQMRLAMVHWLRNLLENTPQKWVIMTMHYPFYSTKPDRSNPKLRKAFKPLVDEYGVDLILQGHDHGYGRGMLDKDEKGPTREGTMYVVSVSGPKMYDVGYEKWMQARGENVQLYQVIRINGDRLDYKSFTTDGELFDAFVLEKAQKGSRLITNMESDR